MGACERAVYLTGPNLGTSGLAVVLPYPPVVKQSSTDPVSSALCWIRYTGRDKEMGETRRAYFVFWNLAKKAGWVSNMEEI